MTLSVHICFLYHFFVFVYVSLSSIEYVIFSISTFAFFRKFQLNYTHKVYTYLSYIIVSYFPSHILLYKCYILS